jgi:glycosyltransferase involved in cell wall biosynthesis
MGMGLPVVASPVLSSLELIQNGVNGYICYELEDWSKALNNLKYKEHRLEITKNYQEIVKKHTTYAIYLRWKKEFDELLG